jgi:hypothetical protein
MGQKSADDDLTEGLLVNVDLTCEPPVHVLFALMFQQGFMLRCLIGSTIRDVLCHQYGIKDDYLDGRINTVFLDGKPVDDVDTARIYDGSVLALSASMPGFAGAALRKGGFYAKMRQGITHAEDSGTALPHEGFFTLKLFNMVAEELGPTFLKDGVWLESKAFEDFFMTRSQTTKSKYLKLAVDNQAVDCNALSEEHWSQKHKFVFFRVITPAS